MRTTRLLLVEDEPGLAMTVADRLRSEGYEVEHAADGDEAERLLQGAPYDLVVLDVMLPGTDGFSLCRGLRRRGVDSPVLMLTARATVEDRVAGLKLGADDYLVKPFEMAELLARVEALLRRRGSTVAPREGVFRFGDVEVDFGAAVVRRDGEPVELSAREFGLLAYLIEHRGALVTREELLRRVWGHKNPPRTRTVDVHVTWLRRKLEPERARPRHILTVHGMGYRFEP